MNDKQILILELTSYCNSNCKDCLRSHMMNNEKYMLKYTEILTILKEVNNFKSNFNTFELKLSGGEPTIWRDGEKDIADIIKDCESIGLDYALVTNGKVFEKLDYCKYFFEKLQKYEIKNLKIYVTIDNYHENYNEKEDNNILENILLYKDVVPQTIFVQSTVNKKKEENISIGFIEKYSNKGIQFMMNPLLPWGRGENLGSVIPTLDLHTNEKSTLGDYEKYFYILGKAKKIWNTYEEFTSYNNLDAIKNLNCCGKTITFMDGKYFYCMPSSDNENFCFAKLGDLNFDTYKKFVNNNKFIQKMKSNDINENDLINDCPIGYGVCALCKKICAREENKNGI